MKKSSNRKKKATRITSKKKFLFWPFGNPSGIFRTGTQGKQRGGIAQTVLLLVVIVGAFYLVGGIFPNNFLSKDGESLDIIVDNTASRSAKESLQLGTIPFKKCTSELNVVFLLDRSGSMKDDTPTKREKIDVLKEATKEFFTRMGDESIAGVQSFNSLSITNDVPIAPYKDVKAIIPTRINAMAAEGGTPTHDAIAFSYPLLQEAVKKYPKKKLNFVFISDGEPNPASQDPRLFTPNPATQIKDLGIEVYAIGIYDQNQTNNPRLEQLLRSVASKPENYFAAPTGDEIKALLSQISQKICDDSENTSPTPSI